MADYLPLYKDAALLTLGIGWAGIAGAIVIGLAVALVIHFRVPVARQLCRAYVELFRNTPLLIQLFFFYFGLPRFGLSITPEFCGAFGLALHGGAYMAESVRGGIISIDPGQTEGAKAIGMTHVQTMVNVIMPQGMRNIIPQIDNNFIINIKDTSVMFVIGFVEFFATHRNIVGVNLLYFPSAVIEMAGYLMLTLAASFLLRLLEKRLDGSDNYELVSADALAMSAGTYSHPSRKTPFDERSGEFGSGRPKGDY